MPREFWRQSGQLVQRLVEDEDGDDVVFVDGRPVRFAVSEQYPGRVVCPGYVRDRRRPEACWSCGRRSGDHPVIERKMKSMGIKATEARATTRGKDLSPALADAYALFSGGAELTSRQVAEALDVKTSTAWQRVRALFRKGRVRRVNGVGPGHPAVYKKAGR